MTIHFPLQDNQDTGGKEMDFFIKITEPIFMLVLHFYSALGESFSRVSDFVFFLLVVLTVLAVEGAALVILKNVMVSIFFATLRKIRKSKYLKRLAFRSVDNLEKILLAIDKSTQSKGAKNTHGNRKNTRG